MEIFAFEGESKTREKIIPGNTPTGISAAIRLIPDAGLQKQAKLYNVIAADLLTNGSMEATT